jgi:N-acetylneuraminic acid mutarotase
MTQGRKLMVGLRFLQVTAACIVFGALTASAFAQQQGSWEMKAPVPAALNEVTVASVGGKIHVIGGSVLGFTGPYHLEFDPAGNTWRTRAPVPRALDHMGSATLNGKIYTMGGFIGGGVHRDGQNTALEYDPVLDTWRVLAPMSAWPRSKEKSTQSVAAHRMDRLLQLTKSTIRQTIPGRIWHRCRRRATTPPRRK